ncbi:nucleoporin seh1 [Acrodontium crateriforme]|uniref:Nucleoporin seh1 n=1 Tax=Acrodontium crateriforme TaxID=150365 RepID=A0AAQ3M1Q0_9PEZI|nr:nucleoporin seh1 [Acrodontium crateriforme]
MASTGFHRFSHGHQDLVLAVAYNSYGTRMATASSDHRVKVWDRNDKTGQWSVTDVWLAHSAEVTDVKWTGPFVGEYVGSIGEDGLAKIWAEDVNQTVNSGRRFKCIYQQVTATGAPYMSLDFKNLGTETYLAVITRDGYLSVCEPEDYDDLSSWRVLWSDYLVKTPSRTEETGFRLSWHKEKIPAWPAVLAGLDKKSLSLAVATGSNVQVFRTDKNRKFYIAATLEGAKGLVRDVAWANGSMRGFDLLATASKDGYIRIYELHTPGAASLSTSSHARTSDDHKNGASSSSQSHLQSAQLTRSMITKKLASGPQGLRDDGTGAHGAIRQDAKLAFELDVHSGAPWRINWSYMGDILVSTGDDGTIRLWRKSVDGRWLEAAEIDASKDS